MVMKIGNSDIDKILLGSSEADVYVGENKVSESVPDPLVYMPFANDAVNQGTGGSANNGVVTNVTFDTEKANFVDGSQLDIQNLSLTEFTAEYTLKPSNTEETFIPSFSFLSTGGNKNTLYHKFSTDNYCILFNENQPASKWCLHDPLLNVSDDFTAEIKVQIRYRKNAGASSGTMEVFIDGKRNSVAAIDSNKFIDITQFTLGEDLLFTFNKYVGYYKELKIWDEWLNDEQLGVNNPAQYDDYKFLACSGQSNMEGFDDPNLDTEFPDNVMYWSPDNKRFEYRATKTNFGFYTGAALARNYTNSIVAVVNISEGGQEISRWDPGAGSIYDDLVAETLKAKSITANTSVDWMAWMQGEKDEELGNSAAYYEGKLTTLISNLRTEAGFGFATMPFIAGEIYESWGQTDVHDTLVGLNSDGDNRTACMLFNYLASRDFNVHYENSSYLTGGKDFYAPTFINMTE